ncbi:MAG: uroporphyrinogen decarboxylase family protein [Atopobiaceae bacterium]|jgi:hypothetical protein
MERSLVDTVLTSDRIHVSPIGGQSTLFDFCCMGRLTVAETLGFKTEQATELLRVVTPGQLSDGKHPDTRAFWADDERVRAELQSLAWLKGVHDDGGGEESQVPFHGGGCFGPLTLVSDILGADRLLRMVLKEPKQVEALLDYVTEFLVFLAMQEAAAGQDLFWIAEPVASLLAPKKLWDFCGKWIHQIYEAAEAPGVLHVCGKTDRHTEGLLQAGACVLSIDYLTDMPRCLKETTEKALVMGNISPMLMRDEGAEAVRRATDVLLDQCSPFPNFILGTGCAMIHETPEENVQVLFDEAAKRRKATI